MRFSSTLLARLRPRSEANRSASAVETPAEATEHAQGEVAPARLSVRVMEVADIEAVQHVERAAGERFRAVDDPRIARCADDDPMGVDPLTDLVTAGRAWVAAADGEIVGFVAVGVVDGCGHVEEVAVTPAWSDRGIGSSLLERAVTWAAGEGLRALTLTTFRDVPWNRPFYERRGFSVVEDGDLTERQRALMAEEDLAGLVRELRVLMCRDLRASVAVRDAAADDLPAITRLFNALIPTTTIAWRDHLADDTEMTMWFDAQAQGDNPVLVAELAGEVAGYTTWTWFRGGERFPGYRHTRELTIHVDERHHGKGIGRALIDALVERARAADVHVLVAGVDATNDASVEFHRRLGFEVVATMPEVGRKFDRWLDLVLLQRRID